MPALHTKEMSDYDLPDVTLRPLNDFNVANNGSLIDFDVEIEWRFSDFHLANFIFPKKNKPGTHGTRKDHEQIKAQCTTAEIDKKTFLKFNFSQVPFVKNANRICLNLVLCCQTVLFLVIIWTFTDLFGIIRLHRTHFV